MLAKSPGVRTNSYASSDAKSSSFRRIGDTIIDHEVACPHTRNSPVENVTFLTACSYAVAH